MPTRSRTALAVAVGAALAVAACTSDRAAQRDTIAPATGATTSAPVRQNVDGVLRIGVLLPTTGPGDALGQAGRAAVQIAVNQIDAAGGVLSRPVQLVPTPAGVGSDPGDAKRVLTQFIDQSGVDAVIGPATSRAALSLLGALRDRQVVACSPSATAILLSAAPDPTWFVRTAPSDRLLARALANRITGQLTVERVRTVSILYPDDDYGRPIAAALASFLQADGTVTVQSEVAYDPDGLDAVEAVARAVRNRPAALALVALADPGVRLLNALAAALPAGARPAVFATDGLAADLTDRLADPSVLDRVEGLVVDGEARRADDFAKAFPADVPTRWARYAYDCTMLIALAAEAAGTDDPAVFRREISPVSQGVPTFFIDSCTSYDQCRPLARARRNFDYIGALPGNIDLDGSGDPTFGNYLRYTFVDGVARTGEVVYARLRP